MKEHKFWRGNVLYHVPQFTPLLVKWVDPCSYHGWYKPEEWISRIDKDYLYGADCTTTGFLVHVDFRGIVLSMNQGDTESPAGNLFEIPKGCIREVYILE